MKRYTITQYLKKYYEANSRPTRSTIIRRIKRGEIAGEFEGIWYVYPEKSAKKQRFNRVLERFTIEGLFYDNGQTTNQR